MRYALLLALFAITALAQPEYRPLFHFSPAKNWTNDPNGLVYYDSEYHLFYQHNPVGDQWGHMSWGHAVSKDLNAWEELPLALAEENGIMIFSGSAVVDTRNTSGFGKPGAPPLIAIYTGHSKNLQTQNIAYSTDRGRTWTKYSGNPVIDINDAEFRDPMVFWHEPTRRWIMVVALAKAHKVRFYASPDLKKWSAVSDFGPAGAKNIPNWECPSIFPLTASGRTKWILIIGVGDGAAAGGSGTQYFIGDFDGTKFTNDHPADQVLWLDHGADFYAAQTWSGVPRPDGRRIILAWMSNWRYASKIPTAPWRGQMTYPRTLALTQTDDGFRLVQNPVREIERLRGRHTRVRGVLQNEANALLARAAWPATLDIDVTLHPNPGQDAGLELRKGSSHTIRVGYDPNRGVIYIDRTRSGNTAFHPVFAARHEAPLEIQNEPNNAIRVVPSESVAKKRHPQPIQLRILLDRSSIEVFANGGKVALTDLIFPNEADRGLSVFGASTVSLDIWTLARTAKN